MIPVVIGISIFIFAVMQFSPGDPVRMMLGERASVEDVEQMRQELGLDKPKVVQYFHYMGGVVLKGDFGISYITRRPVIDEFRTKFPVTMKLAFLAMIIAIGIGIPVGIYSAIRPYSLFDKVATVLTLTGTSIPPFFLGLILILIFSLGFKILPSSGIEGWKSFILPAVTLSAITLTYLIRVTRASLLEVFREDYIRTARSKGLREYTIITKHAFRNALIPVITTAGLQFGYMLGGAIITETVFAIPGLGRLLVGAIRNADLNVVLGTCLLLAVTFSFVNLLVDILYAFLDPRIKAQYSRSKKVAA